MEFSKMKRFLRAARLTIHEYYRKSSIHWLPSTYGRQITKTERIVWSIAQVIALLVSLRLFLALVFNNHPVITLRSITHVIPDVPTPKVSVCLISTISTRKLMTFADDVSTRLGIPKDELLHFLPSLRLFYHAGPRDDNAVMLHKILADYSRNSNDTFDPYQTLKMLAPSCSDFIQHCSWNNKNINCSKVFVQHVGSDQFCCSIRDNNEFKIDKKHRLQKNSAGLQLSIVFKRDDKYLTHQHDGAYVQIFKPGMFPDRNVGGLREVYASAGMALHLQIAIEIVKATPDITVVPLNIRRCSVKDTSYHKCVFDCKLDMIFKICGCVPFIYVEHINFTYPQCTLLHSECLFKHESKFRTFQVISDDFETTEFNEPDAIKCNCYPPCSDITYNLFSDLDVLAESWKGEVNYSKIYIYLDKPTFSFVHKDIRYHWYDLVSTFGGIMSAFFGASFISIIELFYFATVTFIKNLFR